MMAGRLLSNDPDSKLGCFTYWWGRIQPTYIGVIIYLLFIKYQQDILVVYLVSFRDGIFSGVNC